MKVGLVHRDLHTALQAQGASVERLSSPALPYDAENRHFWPITQIMDSAAALSAQAALTNYDLLSIHFGNLELEQLLPALWEGHRRAPVAYHVHTLAPTLFSEHVPSPATHEAVLRGIRSMDGLVYYGRYAQQALTKSYGSTPATVAWWPTTIPLEAQPDVGGALARMIHSRGNPLISLYGFASPWKSVPTFIQALQRLEHRARAVLAGPFWDDPTQAGITLTAGTTQLTPQVDLTVIPTYLQPSDRSALMHASSLGVFPYQPHPSFQGSGAIGDYLNHGVPVIAADVANMAEVVGPSGLLVPPDDPYALHHALNRALSASQTLDTLRANANHRKNQFTMAEHARRCLTFYRTLTERPHR